MELELRLCAEDTAIPEGNPVYVIVALVNTSPLAVTVNSRFLVNKPQPHEIAFELRRGRTTLAFLPKIRVAPVSTEFQRLAAGVVIGKRVRLDRYFDLPKGAYRLTAKYVNHDDPPGGPPPAAWKGEVVSPAIRFRVR